MKITLPKDWSQVTLKQFQAIQALLEDEGTVYSKNAEIISVVSGMDISEVERLSLESYTKVMNALEFITQPIEKKLKRDFKLNGKRYRVVHDIYQITGGQYITLQHLLGNPESVIDNLHHIMAVFVIPYERKWWGWKRGEYNADKHEEVAQEMLSCPIDIIHPLSGFFLDNWKRYAERMLESSVKETKKAERTLIRELKRIKPNTAGWQPSIPYLITMLRNGVISSTLSSESSSISSAFKRRNKPTTSSN
jgi:hypothetical protein